MQLQMVTGGGARSRLWRSSPHVWHAVGISSLVALVFLSSGVGLYSLFRLSSVQRELAAALSRMEQNVQELDAGVSFDSKRRQLLLGIRDQILEANPRLSLDQGYRWAALLVAACEKYPSVDPLLLLSVGIVESGFDPQATSRANARGLYQIWPSTGRMLARLLDWEYSDEMLYDPEKNTEMAALYLDILFSAYNDARLVLAEYNGGPINAGFIRAGSERAARETQHYVVKVMDVFRTVSGKIDRELDIRTAFAYRDREPAGERLGPSQPLLVNASP